MIILVKDHNDKSQGGIKVNGSIILQIPKSTTKEDILYFNERTKSYNIKQAYIVGFLPVVGERCVEKWVIPIDKARNNVLRKK